MGVKRYPLVAIESRRRHTGRTTLNREFAMGRFPKSARCAGTPHAERAGLAVTLMGLSVATLATPVRVEIITQILPFDPESGMKSTQVLMVDFDKKAITQTFSTGVTKIGPVEIGSVRDKFLFDNVDFSSPGRVGFTARGQTASGVLFMPNINYKFQLAVTPAGKGAFSGCHDGYPAYQVKVAGKVVYDFKHQPLSLVKLFGECDVEIKAIVDF